MGERERKPESVSNLQKPNSKLASSRGWLILDLPNKNKIYLYFSSNGLDNEEVSAALVPVIEKCFSDSLLGLSAPGFSSTQASI